MKITRYKWKGYRSTYWQGDGHGWYTLPAVVRDGKWWITLAVEPARVVHAALLASPIVGGAFVYIWNQKLLY